MSKKFQLKERESNENIFPVTLSECVYKDNTPIEEVFASKEELSNVISEEVVDNDTFPEIGTVTREQLKKDLFIDLWN